MVRIASSGGGFFWGARQSSTAGTGHWSLARAEVAPLEPDADHDAWPDDIDASPGVHDPCNEEPCADPDADYLCDPLDPCPDDAGNDSDEDGLCESADDCPTVANSDQADFDGDAIGDACDGDLDGDLVADEEDLGAGTALGDVADLDGCSIPRWCPCDHRYDGAAWRGRIGYLACVELVSGRFVDESLITTWTRLALIVSAARSECGRR